MIDKIINTVSLLAFIVLVFLAGFGVAFFKTGPYEILHKGFNAIWVAYKFHDANLNESLFVWPKAHHYIGKEGVTAYQPREVYGDYTLYSPSTEQAAYLIDMFGNVIHKWEMPFSKAWADPPHIEKPVKDNKIFWQGLHLFPNGDLLAVYYAVQSSPAGYGVIKIDKDSKIIWRYPGYAHHDLTVADNGHVYTLTQKVSEKPIEAIAHIQPPVFDEYVTVLSKDGDHIKDISIYKAFADSEYFSEVLAYLSNTKRVDIHLSFTSLGDIIHPNTVSYIDAQMAEAQPLFTEGHILLSLRESDIVAVLDPEKEVITWAKRGFWRTQHSPVVTQDGNIILFDNEGPQTIPEKSRVIEYNPLNDRITWSYDGTEDRPLFSSIRADVQPLPNSNVLVTEYENGRIFEITRDKQIVWEFFTSATLDNNPARISGTHCAHRFAKDNLPFLMEK